MAYTIQLTTRDAGNLVTRLLGRMERDGRFRCDVGIMHSWKGCQITLRKVRLRKAKPYCGQHPGPCDAGGPKGNSTHLEWDDWIAFNNLVNDELDADYTIADVWSTPFDVKGRMWIRKGDRRRVLWDYEERPGGLRIWNVGTDDQFKKAS